MYSVKREEKKIDLLTHYHSEPGGNQQPSHHPACLYFSSRASKNPGGEKIPKLYIFISTFILLYIIVPLYLCPTDTNMCVLVTTTTLNVLITSTYIIYSIIEIIRTGWETANNVKTKHGACRDFKIKYTITYNNVQ